MERARYFEWLISKVDSGMRFRRLYGFLFDIEFRWDFTIELDGDRAEKGKSLRLLYFDETGRRSAMEGIPCTVLEMMVALSLDMENIMGEPGNDHPERWFSQMIDNLGLSMMDNYHFDQERVIASVGRWLGRDYDKNGNHGLFPLKTFRHDQRRVPIWEQACAYMSERV